MRWRVIGLVSLSIGVIAVGVALWQEVKEGRPSRSGQDLGAENSSSSSGSPRLSKARTFSALPSLPRTQSSSPITSVQNSESPAPVQMWREFAEKFGTQLKPEFSKEGNLVSIRGAPGSGTPASAEFHPENPQMAIARAREILAAGRELLGVREDWPLESAAAKNSNVSAQVFFSETYHGVPVAPVGSLKIDLGSQGELVALHSDYASQVEVKNEVLMDSDQARDKAVAWMQKQKTGSLRVDGGGKVVWVKGSDGHFAYQFMISGRQVVVDAQTGGILLTRDRRQF